MKLPAVPLIAFVFLLAVVVNGCGGEPAAEVADRDAAWARLGLAGDEADLDGEIARLADAPVDPAPLVGEAYNPRFPPDLPFDPDEWLTNEPTRAVADPRAVKGGTLRLATPSWPPTLRTEGPASRLGFLSTLHNSIYERLLGYDYVLEDFVPSLATHWQILPDKQTLRFRLDPRARWADGREVTADDVVATIEHLKSPDRKDPSSRSYYDGMIEYARALDRLTVEVKARTKRWRTLLTIGSGISIYPAAYIRMDGETYLEDWNWKLPPGTGPYEILPEDIRKGRSISLTRRTDWWGEDLPSNRGTSNFDKIQWEIVRDSELEYQKFLAGELDLYMPTKAQRWVQEVDREEVVRQGWVQKRKIFNLDPQGFGGFAFNMRKPPFEDRRVRLAFAHLLNRELLMSNFFFHQYEYQKSYFPGSKFTRPDAKRIRYDPERARALLAEAGWTARDDQGHLTNEAGTRFPKLTFEFSNQGWQRIHNVMKHELWNEAGIELELKVLDYTSLLKKVWEYKFDLVWWSWTASNFPAPEFGWHSKNADRPQTNNLNGFRNEEADEIIEKYSLEFDPKERTKLLQRFDEILFETHPYALGWYSNYFRVLYWDRLGHPPEYAWRYGSDISNVMGLWWFDPDKGSRLSAARKAGSPLYPEAENHQYDEVDQRYWLYNELPMEDDE